MRRVYNSTTQMAWSIMIGNFTIDDALNTFEFRIRKGVSLGPEDVQKAIKNGLRSGRGKTENEIKFIALYLSDVFKQRKGLRCET